MKRNVPILGFIVGILLPVLGVVIVYLILFNGSSFDGFWREMKHNHDNAAKVLSLGVLINIAPFIYFINKRHDYAARGVFIATMIYAVIMVLLKWVW